MGAEHLTDVEMLKWRASQLLRGYAARCAARAEVRDPAGEWSLQENGVFCAEIPEGTLAKARDGERWALMLVWHGEYGARVLAQGSHEQVERCAQDVILHGPQGGPEFAGQRPDWHCIGNDDTLHSVTIDGEFRLMPLVSGEHLLMFADNDRGLCVLGVGDASALQRTAHERLVRAPGAPLHVRIGDRRVLLRDIVAGGILGHVDVFKDVRLVLGHLTGDQFGLLLVDGAEASECIGLYSLAELHRGDLGQVLTWNHQARGAAHRQEDDAAQDRQPASTPDPSSPPASTPDPASSPEGLTPLPQVRALSATDLALIDDYLTPGKLATGAGATMFWALFEGLKALVRLGLANQLLYGCQLRLLIMEHCRIELHCSIKTFCRTLRAAAAYMRGASPAPRVTLLTPVGKRWLLRVGDLLLAESELLRCIAEAVADRATTTTRSAAGPSPRPALDTEDPASGASDPTRDTAWSADEPVEPLAWPTPASPAHTSGQPSPAEGRPAPAADIPDSLVQVPPAGNKERLPTLEEVLARKYTCQRLDPGNIMRVSLASVPDSVSASRWKGRKSRYGPE
jgi:hypothetical protein